MALSLKFADAYITLSLDRKRYDSDMLAVQRDLTRLPGAKTITMALNATQFRKDMVAVRAELVKLKTFPIRITVDRVRAAADLNLVRQQAELMQRRSFGTVPIRADLRPWRTAMKSVAFDLYRVRNFANIPIKSEGLSAVHANLNLLAQQLRTIQGLSKLKMSGGRGGGGGGGGDGFSGPGFFTGFGQGLGLPYASSPQMMAGQFAGGGIRGSIATAAGIQSQIAELRRVTGMTAEQANAHKQSIFDLSTTQAGVSVDDLMQISQIGGRAGVMDRGGAKGLLDFTGQLAMVKNAVADMPTEELAESMVKVLNVFELGTDRVGSFGSALTAMDNVSVASARDILNITSRLSGTAQAIGMTLPQVTAFSSVLKDVGLSNEVAGSSFSQIFRKMATDSAKFAAQIGVDAETFANAYRRDPMEALGMVITKFNEMKDTIEGQEFLSELGLKGVRVTGSLQQLATKFELVGQRAKVASAETGSLNALITANNLKTDTLENSYTKLKNALTALADAMGSPMLGPATNATNAITAMVKAASEGNHAMLAKSATAAGLGAGGIGGSLVAGVLGPFGSLLGFGGGTGGRREALMKSLTDDMQRRLFGDQVAAAAKPAFAGAANALPAKNPNPRQAAPPNPNAHVGENLIAEGQMRIGNALAALAETRQSLFNVGGRALVGVAKALPEKKQQTYSSGLSAEDVSRRIQNDILNMTKDKSGEETAKNTKTAATILGEVRDILKRGGGQMGAAVLGQ
jgi:TP901 family phage tail tape measure protein